MKHAATVPILDATKSVRDGVGFGSGDVTRTPGGEGFVPAKGAGFDRVDWAPAMDGSLSRDESLILVGEGLG